MRDAGTAILQALDQNTPRRGLVERGGIGKQQRQVKESQNKRGSSKTMAGKRRKVEVSEDEEEEGGLTELSESENDDDYASPSKRRKTGRVQVEQLKQTVASREKQVQGVQRMINRAERAATNVSSGHAKGVAGTISSIHLQDFMCHRNQKIEPISNINFINGNNGSGKSTFLTAIVVALGGKTGSTGRANGVRDLIRSGCDSATITLTIRNSGPDAIDPEKYGDEITIRRRLYASGNASQWKVWGGNKPIPDARKAVVEICDLYNIQVDNPMTVLTQDQSRAFLSDAEPRKKYDMFTRCTQLDQIANGIEACKENIKANQDTLDDINRMLPERKAEFEKWKAEFDASEQLGKLEEQVDELKGSYAWAVVQDKESTAFTAKSNADKVRKKVDGMQSQMENDDDSIAQAAEIVAEKEKARDDFVRAAADLEADEARVGAEWKRISDQIKHLLANINERKGHIKTERKKQAGLQAQIDAENAKVTQSGAQNKREQLELALKHLRASREKHEAELTQAKNDVLSLTTERDELNAQLAKLKRSFAEAQKDVGRMTDDLARTKAAMNSKDKLGRYGTGIEHVLEEIKRTKWHHSEPIGPLGQYITLKADAQQYRQVLDSYMNSVMTSWAVRDVRDRATLYGIFQRNKHKTNFVTSNRNPGTLPNIITHAGELFDFSQGDMSHRYPTVLSKLDFTNEHVLRIAVNGSRIEGTLICATRQEAQALARRVSTANYQPSVLSADMQRTQATRSGGMSNIVQQPWTSASLFAANLEEDIRRQQAQLDQARQDLAETNASLQAKQREVAELTTRIERCNHSTHELRQTIRKEELDIDRAERDLRADEPLDLAALHDSVNEIGEGLERDADQIGEWEDAKAELEVKSQEIKAQKADLRNRRQAYNGDLQRLENALDAALKKKGSLEDNAKNHEKRLQTEKAKLEELETIAQQADAAFEKQLADAELIYGARQFPTKSSALLAREADAAEKALQRGRRRAAYTRGEIRENLSVARESWETLKESEQQLRKMATSLVMSTKQCEKGWRHLRETLTKKAVQAFWGHLQKRNFLGKLNIDHENRELTIRVQTDLKADRDGNITYMEDKAKDPKALSGGETSFTTICLLLSLWDCMSCPIRCLDEFDVYMDAHNRKKSMDLLIEAAKDRDNQFILITPQSMTHVKDDPKVKKLRLQDPHRQLPA